MLKQVILYSSTPVTIDIDNADPDEIIILKSISGLTPADLTLFTGEYSSSGGYYQGRRAAKRNPVFNFKLNPNYVDNIVISDVREMLYKIFLEPQSLADGLQVTLIDDRKPDRYMVIYSEKWDGDIFTDKPVAGISTVCTDPYLRSVNETGDTNGAGWVSVPFTYEGSADTGIEVWVEVTATTNQVVVDLNGQKFTLSKPTNFVAGDDIYINTKQGERAVQLNGVDVMALLTASSPWLAMTQSDIVLSTYGTVVADGKSKITEYKYRGAWWGV